MITQKFNQGKHEIKIETAESLEDAKKNNFPEGIYTKHYLDGKPIENYVAMMRFIAEEAKSNNSKIIPSEKDIFKIRNELLSNQNKKMREQLENIRKQYQQMSIPEHLLKNIDNLIDKLDVAGVRVVE